jgi:hypothetical protein
MDHFDEIRWATRLPPGDDFSRRLEQPEDLAFSARIAAEDARSGLFYHLVDARHRHRFPDAGLLCFTACADRLTFDAFVRTQQLVIEFADGLDCRLPPGGPDNCEASGAPREPVGGAD